MFGDAAGATEATADAITGATTGVETEAVTAALAGGINPGALLAATGRATFPR